MFSHANGTVLVSVLMAVFGSSPTEAGHSLETGLKLTVSSSHPIGPS